MSSGECSGEKKKQGRKNLQGKKGRSELQDSLREGRFKDPAEGACVVNINGGSMAGVERP